MELAAAVTKAFAILGEEIIRPTVRYSENYADDWKVRAAQALTSVSSSAKPHQLNLHTQRQHRPRPVHENPNSYTFGSTNFNLLIALYGQIAADDRAAFIDSLLSIVHLGHSREHNNPALFPSFLSLSSSHPLLLEFCVRTGNADSLFRAIEQTKKMTPGLVLLLMQLEDIVALNFNQFSDSQLKQITVSVSHFQPVAEEVLGLENGKRISPTRAKRVYLAQEVKVAREIHRIVAGLNAECKQASFWYLKNDLQPVQNLEILQDKAKVTGFLSTLGFSDTMTKALDAADAEYRSAATAFDLKHCMDLLRSFLEHLHREAAKAIAKSTGSSVADKWGDATKFLRTSGFISQQEEAFVTSLYTLASDTGSHPLIAEREYARLFRNVVIEYGVLFLTALDKKGITLKTCL